jgi:hypothetical protein
VTANPDSAGMCMCCGSRSADSGRCLRCESHQVSCASCGAVLICGCGRAASDHTCNASGAYVRTFYGRDVEAK